MASMPAAPPEAARGSLSQVLEEIRRGRASARADLVVGLALSRNIVVQRVAELVDRGLVVDGDAGASTGGRPPRQLTFRSDAGHLLVADLGATSIDVALTTLGGSILGHRAESADISAGPELVLARVEELFDDLLASDPPAPGRLWGIGIGVPGPVEFRSGRPVSPPIMPGWDGYAVRERFEARFGAPVWVDNDVNVLALGEWRAGLATGHDNVIVVKVGTGIGAGIISDGRLHRGAQGAAGDVGHIQISDDASVICRCGNVGCLEAMAGGAAIARDGELAARDGRSPRLRRVLQERDAVTAEDVAQAAAHGDPVCVALLQGAGTRIGSMLAAVVNFFNPSLIVIGGGMGQSGDRFLASIRETVYRRSLPLATRDLRVVPSSLGALAGVVGAASMVADELFSPERLGETLDWANGHDGATPPRPRSAPRALEDRVPAGAAR